MEVHSLVLKSDSRQIGQSSKDLDKLSKSAGKADNSTAKLTKTTNTATSSLMGMKTAVVSIVAALGVAKIIGYADSWSLVNSRLKLATDSTEEFSKAQKELFEISQLTRQEFTATADLYSRMARATKSLGTNQEDLLKVTQTVNEALIVSGASAQEASSVITQLGQGLASGVLRGEEFNSIMENGSRVALALADSLGVNLGQLRAMATEGALTSDIIVKALVDQADTVHSEFSEMKKTVGQSTTQISNSFLKMVGKIDTATNASGGLSDILTGISTLLDDVTAKFERLDALSNKRAEFAIIKEMEKASAIFTELDEKMKISEGGGFGAKNFERDKKAAEDALEKVNELSDKYVSMFGIQEVGQKKVISNTEKIVELTKEQIKLQSDLESRATMQWAESVIADHEAELKLLAEELQLEADLLGFQDSINDALREEKALREENLESVKEMAKALTKNLDFAGYGNNLEEEKTSELGNQISATGHLMAVTANGMKEGSKGQDNLRKATELAAIAAGAVAILTQASGDPYTAFARMAAMAVSVASILSSGNISGGGGSVTNSSVTEATSFRALGEASTPDVKFDDFIEGLESASKALEDFGNVGSSIAGQIEALQTQMESISESVALQEAELAQRRIDLGVPSGTEFDLIRDEGTEGAGWEVIYLQKAIDKTREKLTPYVEELNSIVLESVIDALDFSKLSIDEVKDITAELDIQSYKELKAELEGIAIATKLAGGVLDDNTRVLEIWSDTNFQAGEDMKELIEIIDDFDEAVLKTRDSLEKELLLLKTTDDVANLALRRQYEMNELTDEGNKLLLQQIFDEEDRQSLLEETIRLIEEANRAQEAAQRNSLQSQINAYREQESALNTYLSNIASQISMLEGSFKSLKDIVSSLRGQTLGADYTLQEFYASMKETQELSLTSDFEAFSKSVSDTIGLSRVLSDVSAFGNIERDMLFAQGVAARQFELLEDNTLDQIDYLKLIEENTREQLNSLANQITILNNQLSAIGTSNELLTEIDTNGDGVMDTRLVYDDSGNLIATEKIIEATEETMQQVSSLKEDAYLSGIWVHTKANVFETWKVGKLQSTTNAWLELIYNQGSGAPGTTVAVSTVSVDSLSVPETTVSTASTSSTTTSQTGVISELRQQNRTLLKILKVGNVQVEGIENTNEILSEESA